jgi:hypothetical protein
MERDPFNLLSFHGIHETKQWSLDKIGFPGDETLQKQDHVVVGNKALVDALVDIDSSLCETKLVMATCEYQRRH